MPHHRQLYQLREQFKATKLTGAIIEGAGASRDGDVGRTICGIVGLNCGEAGRGISKGRSSASVLERWGELERESMLVCLMRSKSEGRALSRGRKPSMQEDRRD